MQRQGIQVSIRRLKQLIKELQSQREELAEDTGLHLPETKDYLVSIINDSDCADTWRFED